jgi:Ca-activated chloride channel family protein
MMTTTTTTALLAATLAATQAPLVFRTEVGVVRVEALVTRDGSPVGGLAAADFELRDNGVLQELEPITEEQTPVDAVLVLDASGSVLGPKLASLSAAAGAFLDGLRRGEQAALLAFNHEVRLLQPLTTDLAAVRGALDRVSPRGNTALVDAVYSALRLREPGERRTAIVVFSDGIDTLSWLSAPEVVAAAGRSNATVYGVTVRGKRDAREPFPDEVARATGGRVFEASTERDLRARFLDVLEDIRARYVLRYVPRGVDASGWHAVEVRLKKGKGDVLSRPGYWRAAAE